jgi:hypothetical protein
MGDPRKPDRDDHEGGALVTVRPRHAGFSVVSGGVLFGATLAFAESCAQLLGGADVPPPPPEAGAEGGRRDAGRGSGPGVDSGASSSGSTSRHDAGSGSGSDGGHHDADAPQGSSADAGHHDAEAARDSGADAAHGDADASLDSGADARRPGADAAVDSGVDGGHDGAGEAGRIDAGHDSGTDAVAPSGPGANSCVHATYVTLSDWRVDLPADTTGAAWVMNAPCALGASPASDAGIDAGQINNGAVFYRFEFSRPVFFYADTFGTVWDTVLFLLSEACVPLTTTTPGDAVCDDDSCNGLQSQVVALLQPGVYVLGLTGYGPGSGASTIHVQYALAASGTETPLPQGPSVQSGTTEGDMGNIDDESPACIAAGPENGYWWTNCPGDTGGTLTASTCDGGASWETVVALEEPGSEPYTCALDTCPAPYGMQSSLAANIPAGAGLRVLVIDGEAGNSAGPYTMDVVRP